MIPVTKPYLPNREKLDSYLDGIYERKWLTNNGVLVQELTHRLEEYLEVENLLLVANGTLALQVAYRALGVNGDSGGRKPEAITTPFSFVATASSLKWEGITPVFADIDPLTWCMDPSNIESAINPDTRAIVPVHVFGNPCDIEAIGQVANEHKLSVIYDASHAFGVKYKGESLLKHGDAATLSFHATKLFHTAEGGAIVFKRKEDLERAKKIINFGITGPESIEELGINAKMSELHAAMGLCVLDEIEEINRRRQAIWKFYQRELEGWASLQRWSFGSQPNFAYMPILFSDENELNKAIDRLLKAGIQSRRYFYPSLDLLGYLDTEGECLISRNVAGKILCLPMYPSLEENQIVRIIEVLKEKV